MRRLHRLLQSLTRVFLSIVSAFESLKDDILLFISSDQDCETWPTSDTINTASFPNLLLFPSTMASQDLGPVSQDTGYYRCSCSEPANGAQKSYPRDQGGYLDPLQLGHNSCCGSHRAQIAWIMSGGCKRRESARHQAQAATQGISIP